MKIQTAEIDLWAWYLLDETTWVPRSNRPISIYKMTRRHVRNVIAYLERIPRDTLDSMIYLRYFAGPMAHGYDADTLFDEIMGGDHMPDRTDREQRAFLYPCYESMLALTEKRAKAALRRRNTNRRRRRQKRGW